MIAQQRRAEPGLPAKAGQRSEAAAPPPAIQHGGRAGHFEPSSNHHSSASQPQKLTPGMSTICQSTSSRTLDNPTAVQSPLPPATVAGCRKFMPSARGGEPIVRQNRAERDPDAADRHHQCPRGGGPDGKRDCQVRPDAGAPRHAPQAARDLGFCNDKAAFAATDVPRRGRRLLRGTGGVHNPRVPQDRTRVPQERTRVPQERTRAPQERTRVPQERPRLPQGTATRAPGSRAAGSERELQVTEMLARLARSSHN